MAEPAVDRPSQEGGEGPRVTGAHAVERRLWAALERVQAALDSVDVPALQRALTTLAADTEQVGVNETPLVTIALFDALRATAATLRSDGAVPLAERERWMRALTASALSPAARSAAFRLEAQHLIAPLDGGQPHVNPTVLRAMRYIDAHAAERISLSRVAREIGLARNYLSSLFHRECGLTLTEYIHRVRIRQALTYLEAGRHSMSEIAALVGYGSYRHFHRRFRRLMASSPKAFLKARRSGGAETAAVQAQS